MGKVVVRAFAVSIDGFGAGPRNIAAWHVELANGPQA